MPSQGFAKAAVYGDGSAEFQTNGGQRVTKMNFESRPPRGLSLQAHTTVRADIDNPSRQAPDPLHRDARIVVGPKGRYRTRGIVRVYARLITVKQLVDPDTQQPL